jgi:hypothetical protein
VRRKNAPEDPEDFVDFRVSREQRLAHDHLGKDAPDGPHVDSGRVMSRTEEDFGGAIPEGDNLFPPSLSVCSRRKGGRRETHLVRVGTKRNSERAGESKVGELEVAFFVDEEVLGLEVAVKDAVGVEVIDAVDELVGLLQVGEGVKKSGKEGGEG